MPGIIFPYTIISLTTHHPFMASIKNNITGNKLTAPKGVKIGIVQSVYNSAITAPLLKSCIAELKKAGMTERNIIIRKVPGAWEIPFACQRLSNTDKPDAIITLGLVLKGQTPHFDFIASTCAQGIMDVSLKINLPIIFGVLTTNTLAQAKARINGGARGDKGKEAAQTAINMINPR